MTITPEGGARSPLTLARANLNVGTVGALVIAAGTPFQIVVRDARSIYRWSAFSFGLGPGVSRHIVYHHTAGGVAAKRSARYEVNLLTDMAHDSEWGLPYNFIVMPVPPFRIYYLNDVDRGWPHTYDWNHACAIAAYGDYQVDQPDQRMVRRMLALADALASMWGHYVPEFLHRDVNATLCPGDHLASRLRSLLSDRSHLSQLD